MDYVLDSIVAVLAVFGLVCWFFWDHDRRKGGDK